jgi:hypothetical protein
MPSAASFLTGVEAATSDAAPSIPAEVQALRDETPSELFDAWGMHSQAVTAAFDPLMDPMMDEGQRETSLREVAEIVSDLGANHSDVDQFATLAQQFTREPPSEEQEADLVRECVDGLRRKYGPEWLQVAADARRLAARDPRLVEYLEETRLGSHPKVVLRLAEIARSERLNGRLK